MRAHWHKALYEPKWRIACWNACGAILVRVKLFVVGVTVSDEASNTDANQPDPVRSGENFVEL